MDDNSINERAGRDGHHKGRKALQALRAGIIDTGGRRILSTALGSVSWTNSVTDRGRKGDPITRRKDQKEAI